MKYFKYLTVPVLLALLFSCGLEIPQSVTVKSTPTINVPLGSRENILSNTEGLDISSIIDSLTDPESDDYIEGLSRMDVAADQPVTLMLTKDIVDISVDGFAADTLDLSGIQPEIQDIDLTIPEIDFTTETLVLDEIPADQITFDPVTLENIPEVTGEVSRTLSISYDNFTSATFSSGTLNIDLSTAGGSAGLAVQVNSASIDYGGASDLVSTSTMPVSLDGTISFDLTGITLTSSFDVSLNIGIISGGGTDFDITFQTWFSSDSVISAATDVTIDSTVEGTIDIPLAGSDFESAEIGSGEVSVDFDFPAAWNITSYSLTLTLQQSDGSGGWTTLDSVSQSNTTPVIFDLSGITIDNNAMQMEFSASLLSDPESADVSVPTDIGTVSGSIDSFSTVSVYTENLNFSESINEPIDTELNDLLAAVEFTNPQLAISIDNQLPIDIQIDIDSTALRVSDSNTFTSGTNSSWTVDFLPAGGGDDVNVLSIPDTLTEVTCDVTVSSPNYNDATRILTMNNVVPGDTYTMSGTASVNLALTSITIDNVNETYQFPDSSAGEDGFDLSAFGDYFDGATFPGITGTLNTDVGTLLDNSGSIGLQLVTVEDYNGDGDPEYLLGDAGGPYVFEDSEASTPINNLDTIINAFPSNLVFDLTTEVSGTTIPASGSDQNITASLEIVIPIEFLVSDPEGMELLDENDNPVIPAFEDDLFGRTSPEDAEEMNEILAMAEGVTITIDTTNTLGLVAELEISAPGSGFTAKTLSLASGEQTITFTSEDIAAMIGTIPFTPEFHITIPPGTHSINQGSETEPADISLSVWLEIETDIDYTIGGDE